MGLQYLGCTILVAYLFLGWWWMPTVGLILMITGMMFSHKPPQTDPVWRKLVADGVIEDDDCGWDDAYREKGGMPISGDDSRIGRCP